MIQKNVATVTITGKSGKEYGFTLHRFDSYSDVKDGFNGHGLYLFGKLNDDKSYVNYIYLGMAPSLNTRFDNHHKEACIKRNSANCIGMGLYYCTWIEQL